MKSFTNGLLELLMEMKEKPWIYLGEKSLKNLQHFIHGATFTHHKVSGVYEIFLPNFQHFIRKKYDGGGSNNEFGIILENTTSDEEALDTYFKLLDEFLALSQEEQDKYIPKYIKEQMKASDQIE